MSDSKSDNSKATDSLLQLATGIVSSYVSHNQVPMSEVPTILKSVHSVLAGLVSGMGFSPYAASKFAVVNMSEGLALELRPLGIGVSVLCPGFVRTRISDSARTRHERYGPAPSARTPLASLVAERVEAGLDPAIVARQVLTAIHEDQLYIFTHPEMRAEMDQRFAAIQAAMDRAVSRA